MIKYYKETIYWNSVYTQQPQNYEQAFSNAENFLMLKGACIIAKSVDNYWQRLTEEDRIIFEKLLKI